VTTCFIKYEIDPDKLAELEHYARTWITLVGKLGGQHHGYLLPSEGPGDIACTSFSFESLAAYETYRQALFADAECQAALAYARETGCIRRYERNFFRPVFEGL